MLNRVRAQLRMKGHPSRALQADWDSDGPGAFLFEVVDLLPPSDDPEHDSREDLVVLEVMWREKLKLREEATY